jgi:hypothetical protein
MARNGYLVIDWREALFATRELTPTDVAVGCALSSFMDRNGKCWPAVPSVAAKAHCSDRQAKYSLRKLECLNFVQTGLGGGRHKPNRYRINPTVIAAFSSRNPAEKDTYPALTAAEDAFGVFSNFEEEGRARWSAPPQDHHRRRPPEAGRQPRLRLPLGGDRVRRRSVARSVGRVRSTAVDPGRAPSRTRTRSTRPTFSTTISARFTASTRAGTCPTASRSRCGASVASSASDVAATVCAAGRSTRSPPPMLLDGARSARSATGSRTRTDGRCAFSSIGRPAPARRASPMGCAGASAVVVSSRIRRT